MNAYKFNTRVSNNGTITLPYGSRFYDTEVEVFVVPAVAKKVQRKHFSAQRFVQKWQGCAIGMEHITDEDLNRMKLDRLQQKHA